MLYVNQAIPTAVLTGWQLGAWLHQPRVEPSNTGDLTMFAAMARPPAMTGLRSFT
jgi:hypothetical protein